MVKVRFIRHGESEFNKYNINTPDYTDAQLTDLGVSQAKTIAGRCDLLLVSPLRRARQTAEYSNIIYSQSEISYDVREYKKFRCYADFLESEEIILEGEEDVRERCINTYEKIINSSVETIYIISHLEFIRAFHKNILGVNIHHLGNCSYLEVDI